MADVLEINYDELEQVARRFDDAAGQMAALRTRLRSESDNLGASGWQGRGWRSFERELGSEVLPALQRLAQALQEAGRGTRDVIEILLSAEAEAADGFRAGGARPGDPVQRLTPSDLRYPTLIAGGGAFFPVELPAWLPVPGAARDALASFDPSRLPDWLRSLLPSLAPPQLISPLAPDDAAPAAHTAVPAATPPPAAAVPAAPSRAAVVPETHEPAQVPLRDQHGLKYKLSATEYGCVPTSASMILDYWHQRDPHLPALSAQELLDRNVKQDEFGAHGMALNQLGNDVGEQYAVDTQVNSGRSALENALSRGPVIANVHLNMKSSGNPHAVVVTGVAADGTVSINDPWTGKAHTYAWTEFDASWGGSFGHDRNGTPYATRIFTTIVPQGL